MCEPWLMSPVVVAESQTEPEKHYRTIPSYPYQRPAEMSYDAFQKQVRRDKRYARYEAARTLFEQGLSQRAIARKLRLSRKTVRTFVRAETYPERTQSTTGARIGLMRSHKERDKTSKAA
jgi:predicted DNA-binding protein (UPF0251 family)